MKTQVDNMAEQVLPRLSDIKTKVDMGRELSEMDIRFMAQVTHYAQRSKRLIDRLPEWQNFFTDVLRLHEEIVDKVIDNAEKTTPLLL